jgi:hypothetical protein
MTVRAQPRKSPAPKNQAETVRRALMKTFLQRSGEMLERLSAAASSDTLHAALAAPSDVGGVATLLSDLAPLGLDLGTLDPLVESLARGALVKQDLLRQAGGALTAGQVAELLGISRQAVDKRRHRGTLLAVPTGSGENVYPACQFTPDGVVPHLESVLGAIGSDSPWTRLSLLLAPAPALAGKNLVAALSAGHIDKAVAVAAAFGEQGA